MSRNVFETGFFSLVDNNGSEDNTTQIEGLYKASTLKQTFDSHVACYSFCIGLNTCIN